jgi:hypothetical protein
MIAVMLLVLIGSFLFLGGPIPFCERVIQPAAPPAELIRPIEPS